MRALWVFGALFSLFYSGNAWADKPVFYSFLCEDGHYNFDGGFAVKADPSVVWDVLTDYNHYNRFISNLKAKVIKGNLGEDRLVEQDAGGGFLFIQEHLRARLDIHEVMGQSISFQDIDHKQFALYAGAWTLQSDPQTNEVRVLYDLQATRSKTTPDFLTTDLFGSSLGDLLLEMKKEMTRREAKREKDNSALAAPSPTAKVTPVPSGPQR